jgi:Uma2 family endonuclease
MVRHAQSTILDDAVAGHVQIATVTVDQYHRMVEGGLLDESPHIELIDGLIVRKDRSHGGEDQMTVGREHAWVITQLQKLAPEITSRGSQLRLQLPVTLSTNDEPEPDGAIVRIDPNDYATAHPTASDVRCIIEVADSSLAYDRSTKRRIYASVGIGTYVIVNLPDRCVEVYTVPFALQGQYEHAEILRPGELVTLPADAGNLTVPAASVLPSY